MVRETNVLPNKDQFDFKEKETEERLEAFWASYSEPISIAAPPYLFQFQKWLISNQKVSRDHAKRLTDALLDAVVDLSDEVGFSLYELLISFLEKIPAKTGSDLTKECAVLLVDAYIEELSLQQKQSPMRFSKKASTALWHYRLFIAEKAGVKECSPLDRYTIPHEARFVEWMEKELNMGYENADKVLSSLRCSAVWIKPLCGMDFDPFTKAASLSTKEELQQLLKSISLRVEFFFRKQTATQSKLPIKKKTINNTLTNIRCYFNFISDIL